MYRFSLLGVLLVLVATGSIEARPSRSLRRRPSHRPHDHRPQHRIKSLLTYFSELLEWIGFHKESPPEMDDTGVSYLPYLDPTEALMFGTPLPFLEQDTTKGSSRDAQSRAVDMNNSTPLALEKLAKVVGGSSAGAREAPFFALLLHWNQDQWTYMGCGGTLVSNRHVLTVGHCLEGRDHRQDAVLIHAYQPFLAENQDVPFHFSRVESYSLHPSYQVSPNHNDVAVITLSEPVEALDIFPPIRLTGPSTILQDGDIVHIYGFGRSSEESDEMVDTLQVAQVPFISQTTCRQYYAEHLLYSDMICAGFMPQGGADACKGDSGGPMVVSIEKQIYQVGSVSWGEGCGRQDKPGVYTSTQYHFDWIQGEVCGDHLVGKSVELCSQTLTPSSTSPSLPTMTPLSPTDLPSMSPSTFLATTAVCGLKQEGEVCLYGGQCCSGVCSKSPADNSKRLCLLGEVGEFTAAPLATSQEPTTMTSASSTSEDEPGDGEDRKGKRKD